MFFVLLFLIVYFNDILELFNRVFVWDNKVKFVIIKLGRICGNVIFLENLMLFFMLFFVIELYVLVLMKIYC